MLQYFAGMLQTCWRCASCDCLMKEKYFLINLQHFLTKPILDHCTYWKMADAYSVKSTPYNLQCIFLILCSKITDMLNMCIWKFDDTIIVMTYWKNDWCVLCEINISDNLQCIFLILCRNVTDIMKMSMWKFNNEQIVFDKFTAFLT